MVNGELKTPSYKIKEGDIVSVRLFPKASAGAIWAGIQTVSTILTAITVVAAVGAVVLYNICPAFKDWVLGLFAGDGDSEQDKLKENPTISGQSNGSAKDKPVPVVLGKHLMTPYLLGVSDNSKGYTIPYGTYGENRYFYGLYMVGYKPLKVRDLKLKYADLAKNTDGHTSGSITVDGTSFDSIKDTIQLEIQDENEISFYSQKVVQENINSQLIYVKGTKPVENVRFSAMNPQKIQVEVAFQGLYRMDSDGDRQRTSVKVHAEYSFDETNWIPFGFTGGGSYTYSERVQVERTDKYGNKYKEWETVTRTGSEVSFDGTNTTFTMNQNQTMYFVAEKEFSYNEISSMLPVKASQENYVYIRVWRVNEDSTDTKYCDKVFLSAVRTWCFDKKKTREQGVIVPQIPVIEELRKQTVRIGMRIKATESLKGNMDALNCIASSMSPVWNGTSWTGLQETSNPASLVKTLFAHPSLKDYKYPDNKINLQKLGELYNYCNQSGFECNTILTQQEKFGDILRKVLNTGHAFPVLDNNQYSFIIDKPQYYPVHILNNQNILSEGLQNTKNFDELPDGLSITFINKDLDYKQDVIECFYDDTINDDPTRHAQAKLEKVEYKYVTDRNLAWRMGKYNLAKRKLRPETWVRRVSVDGQMIGVGDMVEIQDDTILVGIGDGAVIREVTGATIKTYSDIPITDTTKTYGVKVIHADGINAPAVKTYKLKAFTSAGMYTTFKIDGTVSAGEISQGDLCSFGEYGKITTKAICLGKKQDANNAFELTLVPYSEDIYMFDKKDTDPSKTYTIPNFESNVTVQKGITGGNDVLPEVFLTKEDGANIYKEVTQAGSSVIEPPNAPVMKSVKAYRDYVRVEWSFNGLGLANTIKNFVVMMSTDGANTWEIVGYTRDNYFDYDIRGKYYEDDDFGDWRFRLYAVSVYASSNSWEDSHASVFSDMFGVNVANYGTWKLNKPSILSRVSDRTITLIMSMPKNTRADGKVIEYYGNIMYRVSVRKDTDEAGKYYCPASSADPYASEDNYKTDATPAYRETSDVYSQCMPLEGQDTNNIKDTWYQFIVRAVNEAGQSELSEPVRACALCTSIRDIVKANETAKEAYISQLSAISANIGVIKQGSLSGNDNNYWALSDIENKKQGEFRVGDDEQYIKYTPASKSSTGKGVMSIQADLKVKADMSNIRGNLNVYAQKEEEAGDTPALQVLPNPANEENMTTVNGNFNSTGNSVFGTSSVSEDYIRQFLEIKKSVTLKITY